jgi:hypothetical protein
MIIRILQAFEDIVWDPEASPQSVPPPEWAESDNLRKREEKVWLRSHLTMYAKVSDQPRFAPAGRRSDVLFVILERVLGEV